MNAENESKQNASSGGTIWNQAQGIKANMVIITIIITLQELMHKGVHIWHF